MEDELSTIVLSLSQLCFSRHCLTALCYERFTPDCTSLSGLREIKPHPSSPSTTQVTMASSSAPSNAPASSITPLTDGDGSLILGFAAEGASFQAEVAGSRAEGAGLQSVGAGLQGEVDGGSVEFVGGTFATEVGARDPAEYTGGLEHLGAIRVSGADAESFLQGQLSNDVFALRREASGKAASSHPAEAPYPRAQWTGYCTPKGRLIFTGWLARVDAFSGGEIAAPAPASKHEADYLLFLERDLIEPVIRRLRMFVLRAKVRLEDLSQNVRIAGAIRMPSIGSTQTGALHPGAAEEPQPAPAGVRSFAEPIALPVAILASGLRVERSLRVTSRGVVNDRAQFAALWHWLHHLAAEAWIGRDVSERFVPQMVNFERIDGVNFRKGCYPGQEVVARSQYLGKLKRRMALYAWE
ncbi:MAG: folate-binding protein YgfZ, partial [Betaproteobacteria bacterium]|nr:folate-binding protein YgfZ [Betaproteobacteria bacterium]